MASNYERIQASRQRFREQAQISEDSYNKFRQAYVQQVDGDALAAGAKESADRMRQTLRESTGPAKPQQVQRAFAAYNSQIQRLRAYTQAGGSLPGDTRMAQLEREFAQQRADFTAYLRQQQSRQGQPGGALGRQTVDAAQAADDNRFALRQGKKAAEVFLDTSRLTPQQQKAMAGGYASYDTSGDVDRTILAALTGSGTLKTGVLENAQRNRQRAAYQEAAQAARDSGAVRAGQYNQAQEKLDLVDDAITALEKMYPTKDARVLSSQQGMMRSYADRLGITDYTDRDDLLRQLRAQRSRQTRRSDRQAAAAAEQATRYRTAQALEYQLDNPDESLDANYLKRQRDEAKRAYAEKKTFRTRAAYEQAEAAYQERKYRDDQEKNVLEIRQDGGLSKQYQTALESTRGLTAAETALQYVKSDLERDGAVNRDTLGQVREIAGAAGLTLPAGKTDNELRAYLEKLTAKYRSDKNFALANLQHAGYDADKLDEYISSALNAQRMDEYTGRAADFAADSPVGASAASSAANLVSGMGYLAALPRTVANAWRIHTGNPDAYVPLDENSDAFRATRYAETIRQEVARQLQGKTDGKTASFLYDTGMSMLDNILQVGVGMGLLGAPAMAEAAASSGVSAAVAAGSAAASPVSLGMMGLTTASQKLLEMTDEGVDTTTAYNLATAAGAIEVLTEKIGLDEFINGLGRQTAATTLRRIGQQVGRQTLAEGTEEAASDVLNLAADLLLRMDQADFVRDIDRARRQGLSKGEAVWSVVEDQLKQTGVSFAGGALSGALFGLSGAAMNAVSSTDRAMGRQIQRTGGMEQLQKDAAAYGLNADDLTRESSPKALGAMQRQVYRAAEQTAGEIEAFAKQKGYKKAAADALQAAWQGYKETGLNALSPQEFGVAFDTAYQEGRLDAQYGQTGAYLERAATDALTAGLLPETVKYAYLTGTQDGSRAAKRTQRPVHALRERAAERRARRADASEAAATGAAQPGGGLTVMQLDDYTAKLRTAEGKTVTADQLETDAPERQIILQAQDDGYGPQEANALLAHYDGSMAPEAYYEQFREAITAGQDGESLSEARRRAGSGLTAEATKAAWELGQEIQTFLDTDERVGPAGKQALDAMAYGDAGLFEAYYKAGLAGESFAEARGRIGQMTAALEAKLRAAVKAGARDAQGGFTYGRQNSGNGQGRQGSVDPSGRGGRVAEGAEHEQSGAGAAEERSSGEAAGQDTGAAQVSAKALGVPEGTDRATARVLTAEEQTPEQRAKVAEYAKAGAELVLIEGNLEIQGETGTMHARGARIGDRIVVSVNDEGATWEQIARHEAKHRYFEQHPDAVQQEWEQVTGYMDADSIEEWLAYYAGKYAALGDIVDIAYIQEEALCDFAAEIETGKATEKDYRALETVKERAQKNTAQAGSRASIAESEKGRYVQADRQVLQGDDPGRWGRQIETYINEKIRNREDVIFPTEDGHLLALTGRSAYKLTDRHKSQIAKEGRVMLDDASYGVKLRAAAHIDELVQVGRFDRYIEDRRGAHENDIGEDGFNYYTAYFRDFDGSYYRVTFSAGVNENNETVYSIGRIRKRESITRRGSSSGVEAGGAQSRRNRLSSNRSIADRNGNVKGKTAVELAFERAREKKSRLSVAETQTGRSTRYSYAGENANGANSQTLQEYEVQTALWDAMDHADRGDENVIKLGRMPRYVRTLTGIDGDFYIYRNHAYENMATREQAERAGRPTRRGRQDIHFHGLGIDTMTEAILSTEDPLVTIWEKSKDGNPVISMVLPVKDADGAPLYAVMGFYTSNPINGQMKVRPHVLLTISNRALFGEGRRGTVEAINDAIAEKRILSMADIKKVRANLTLTGQHTKLASVTVNALSQNVAQFQREVKQFRAKNKINYSAAETKGDNRYDYKKSFAEQLEDWKAGKIPKADTLVVGPTPEVFRKIGFNALPVTINQRHVDYAINGTKNAEHQIGEAMLRQLPQAMQHPVAIIASETQNDTSVVALLPFTHQGNTVVLPVVVDGFGRQNGMRFDSNAATSIYGRGNAVTKLLTNAINGHNNGKTTLFYLDKIKATALYQGARVTMPKMPESNDGFYHSIRDAGSNVKPKFADVTETQQFKRWFGDWQKKPRSASKVVNADGTPKVVYHGTGSEFWTFDLKKSGTRFGETAEGLFFFTNKKNGYQDSAADYAATADGTPRIVEAYLDIKRPLRIDSKGAYTPTAYFDTHAEEIYTRYLEGDYDGIIVENSDKASDDSAIYMVDNPNQIKSATDNIGTFERGEEDIRYSVDDEADTAADREREMEEMAQELEDERKRSKALESVNRRLREQMKVTPPGTADPASLRMAAKQLSEEYGGALRQKDIAADLQKIWRLRSEGKRGQMLEQVDKLASELVQHYLDKDNPEAETLREIKQTVRATKIYLTPELRSDLDRDGGYQDFRRRNFGRIRLANSGLGVDQFYQELSEQWPAYFPAGIWNPADQLLQIADVIQDGTTVLQRSPMEAFPDGMTYMRNKVLWELGLVRPAKPTAADKVIRQAADAANRDALIDAAAAHEQEQIDKLTAWHQKQLQKERVRREQQMQKLKDRYQERAQAERDWKAEQELKRRLLWHGNKLKRMGRTATPEQQAEIERIFGDINLACQRMTGEVVIKDYIQGMSTEEIRPEGYRDKADPRRTMSVEEGFWHPEVRGDKVVDVERLKAWYENQKKTNPDFIADGRVEDILANWEKKQINTMTPQEVQQLLDVALNIENEIRTQKKLIDTADRREIYQQVLQIVGDIEGTRGRYDRGKLSRPAQWITENTLTPVRLLRRWTGFHDSDPLYQAALALQDGELKQLDYQRRAYEKFEEFTKDKKFMDHLAGKGKQKPIEVTGINEKGETVHVKITPDMRVALYLHSRNYQNLRHIQRGGITVPQYEAYVKGNYTEAYDRGTRLRLMPRDVRAITDKMTTREKNYAERVAQYYDTMSKAEINGVSVKLKGYEIAKVQRYYPIETDKAFIAKEFDALRYDGSVEGKGFLKERQEGGNPILLRDATRTLQKSIRDHALYVGMAIPIRNFNKLRGVSISKSDETGALRYQENSLMKALEEKWGTQAVKHLEQMVTDLSGAQPPQASGAEMLNRIRSNYAGAVLELNPSTALKQLIAYPSAASVLGWDAMAVGLTKWQRVNVKLINRYTPLLWHRMQGFIDADLGDYAKNHGHTPRFLNWNQAGDLAVVKQIWKAAEWKVAHDDQTLLHDVEKWHKATAELFNRVVLESQANYTTMERGEILRTNNVFLRSIAMFKTEPFQAFNVLYDAFANTAAKRRQLAALQQQGEQATAEELTTAENAYRDAKKRIAQAVPAVIASNLLEASIVFAWALFRGKDKDWRDEETDEITAASFFKRLAVTAAGNISGIIPYGSEITELLQAAIGGDRYYGVDLLEASALTDMAETLLDIKNTVAKMFEKKETDEERLAAWGDTAKELVDETLQVLQTLGLPAANIRKSVDAIARWALRIAMGKDAGEYTYRYYTQKSTATGRAAEDAETLLQLALDGENEKLEQAYKMATRIRKADDVGKAVADRVKARVKAGTLDAETAAELLQRFQPDKDADELYWKAREWAYKAQTGAESFGKYTILKDAIFSGGDAAAALQELEAHGVSREDAEGEIRSTIGQWYQGKSADGRTIDQAKAQQLLQEYGSLDAEDAEKTVAKWRCYVETGVAYDEIKTGVLNGSITEREAAQWLQKYGGKDEKSAAETARKYAFLAENPALAGIYGDEEIEKAAGKYAKYGSGIPAERFVKYLQEIDALSGDPDGKGGYISGSRKKKVVAYIAALPLTAAQKDAMMLADYANYSLKGMPW